MPTQLKEPRRPTSFDDEDEDLNFVQRHPALILLAIVLVVGPAIYFVSKKLSNHEGGSSREDIMSVEPLPPPPPPPKPKPTPTPDETPPPDQPQPKMIDQQPVQNETKPAPKIAAPAPLGTSITGPGGSDMGLGSGNGLGGGYGEGGGGGSKYGWFASEVQTRVAQALRSNPRTRSASISHLIVRIWPDANGQITKVRIGGSTGDPALDSAIENDVLTGLQLPDAPPADMPLPIVMRISAQRPQ
jgi:protein TonB